MMKACEDQRYDCSLLTDQCEKLEVIQRECPKTCNRCNRNEETSKVIIRECVSFSNEGVQRPSLSVEACGDGIWQCANMFEAQSLKEYNRNRSNPYTVSARCYDADYSIAALHFCPSSCALCCKLPQYDCVDVDSKDSCIQIKRDKKCNSKRALKKCAHTCGICNRPGANDECPDVYDLCDKVKDNWFSCDSKFMQLNCMKTCKVKSCFTGDNHLHTNAD